MTETKDITELLAKNVLAKLGKPPDFLKCRATHLYGNKYRVNVIARDGRVTDSFFVASEDGTAPEIDRHY